MARTHFLRDIERNTYFRTCQGEPIPYLPDAKTKAEADLYEHQDALTIAKQFYGQKWLLRCEVIEATAGEHAQWRCRKAGRTKTVKRAKSARRIGKAFGGRHKKRLCKACGEAMDSTTPATQHTCEKCTV